MKEIMRKVSEVLRTVFGYGIFICLFVGGLTFFGYFFALCIGGETAAVICKFIYKTIFPTIIKTSTILVLIGLLVMYLNGEVALTVSIISYKNRKDNPFSKIEISIRVVFLILLFCFLFILGHSQGNFSIQIHHQQPY